MLKNVYNSREFSSQCRGKSLFARSKSLKGAKDVSPLQLFPALSSVAVHAQTHCHSERSEESPATAPRSGLNPPAEQ